MVAMLVLVGILSFAVQTTAISILLPLYLYPGTNAGSWSPVTSAIAAYPKVQWSVIINPNSGPGTNSSSPYPNGDYIAGIKSLRKYSNVKLLGYVDTLWGRRSTSDVRGDVDKYAVWTKYSSTNLGMDGIFFDDVPSIYDFQNTKNSQSPNETYFREITSYASTAITTEITPIICNSGNPGASSFFKYCDTMVEFENKFDVYSNKTMDSITSDGGVLNRSAIIMYATPLELTMTTLMNIINPMKARNVQFTGFTDDCCYNEMNGTLLTMVAAACNDMNATNVSTANNDAALRSVLSTGWLGVFALFLMVMTLVT